MINQQFDKRARLKLLESHDFDGKILEIGVLNNPLFYKKDKGVYYLDIKTADELKEDYKTFDNIFPVDFILKDSYENTFKDVDFKFD